MRVVKFRVVKSKRKTLSLSVCKNGEILVRAPYGVSDNRIAEFVQKHERWIFSRLQKLQNKRELNLQNGAALVLCGKRYEITEGRAKLKEGTLSLPAEHRESALLKLVKGAMKEWMEDTVSLLAGRYGFTYSKVRISSSRTRWGSCSKKGTLSFSCFLAFVDPALAYYVAVHELCHTRYFNHSKNFWKEVEKILPDWRIRRNGLKEQEDCLDYLRNV